ncbi:MAG: hypothetical protein KTR22_05235 [Flavobacteriaceae bacterium]|nr:hypothetical protein [Flavobacteriaceae bacterium]
MKHLTQRKNFVKREYTISDSKLYFNMVNYFDSNEVVVSFENIDGIKVQSSSSNQTMLLLAGLGLFGVVTFLGFGFYYSINELIILGYASAVITLALFVIYWLSRESFWKIKLTNGNYLYFLKNVPNTNTTDAFIAELMKSRDDYLRESYFFIDENLGYEDQLQTFRWLKNVNAITKKEFDAMYTDLKKIVKPEKKEIGY